MVRGAIISSPPIRIPSCDLNGARHLLFWLVMDRNNHSACQESLNYTLSGRMKIALAQWRHPKQPGPKGCHSQIENILRKWDRHSWLLSSQHICGEKDVPPLWISCHFFFYGFPGKFNSLQNSLRKPKILDFSHKTCTSCDIAACLLQSASHHMPAKSQILLWGARPPQPTFLLNHTMPGVLKQSFYT